MTKVYREGGENVVAFDCLDCEDTGFCTVWHPEAIAQAMKGEVSWWRTCAVLCTCCAAEEMGCEWPRTKNRVPVFGDQPWHILARRPGAKELAANYNPYEWQP